MRVPNVGKNARGIISLWNALFWMSGPYRKYFLPIVCLFLISAITEVAGLGLIGAYAGLLVSSDASDLADILPFGIGALLKSGSRLDLLSEIGLLLVAIFFLKGIFLIVVNTLIVWITGIIGIRLKTSAVDAYINQPYLKYTKNTGAHYIVSTEAFTQQSLSSIATLLRLVADGILALGLLALLFATNALALISLASIVLGAIFLYDKIFRSRLYDYGKELNRNKVISTQALQEGLLGLKEIRILGQEQYFLTLVETSMRRILNIQVKARIIGLLPEGMLQFALILFLVISVALVMGTGENLAKILPVIGIFGLAGIRLIPIGINVGTSIAQLRTIRPGVSQLYTDLKDHDATKDIEIGREQEVANEFVTEGHLTSFDTLKARNISFTYSGSKDPILSGLDLEIKKGQSIGIMGASGSGKTTLIDILLGLITPSSGSVTVNGVDIRHLSHQWRTKVAYIPQEIFLLNGTIKANIAVGESAAEVDENKIVHALRRAQLGSFVDMPTGLDTWVGERGLRLSGGQRQRVAIARALYFQREIFVMDEATSALDSNTEKDISEGLYKTLRDRTFIIVAHRESTLKRCDVVYELSGGKLVPLG